MSDIVSELVKSKRIPFGYLSYEHVEESSGIYSFWIRGECLYVGMSMNLKNRLEQHYSHETNPILQEHFSIYKNEILMSFLYKNTSEQKLRGLESEIISKLNPIANRTVK